MARFLTTQDLLAIGGPRASPGICQGIVDNQSWLDKFGISVPHRFAHFIGQVGEETDHLHTTTEYASGAAYNGRRDLGNVQPGDGPRYRGHGDIMATGRANHRYFTTWIRKIIPDAPDFEAEPLKLAIHPWALYAAVWYWTSHDLNRLADDNNIEAITHKVNGGLNGYAERVTMYARSGLVLLGRQPLALKAFQAEFSPPDDGQIGAKTRGAIHAQLLKLEMVPAAVETAAHAPPATIILPEAPAIVRPVPTDTAPAAAVVVRQAPAPPIVNRPTFWQMIWAAIFGEFAKT